jgi:hypothetical protein
MTTPLEWLDLYAQTFGTSGGRKVLDDMARACRANASTYVQGDPHQTAFNEGARAVYLRILSKIEKSKNKAERSRLAKIKEEEGDRE